jgi:hypothetical protein
VATSHAGSSASVSGTRVAKRCSSPAIARARSACANAGANAGARRARENRGAQRQHRGRFAPGQRVDRGCGEVERAACRAGRAARGRRVGQGERLERRQAPHPKRFVARELIVVSRELRGELGCERERLARRETERGGRDGRAVEQAAHNSGGRGGTVRSP